MYRKTTIKLLDKAEKKGIAGGIEKGRLEERATIIAEKKRIAEEKHALELKLKTILEEAHTEKLELEATAHAQACESARMLLEAGIDTHKIVQATGLTINEIEQLK